MVLKRILPIAMASLVFVANASDTISNHSKIYLKSYLHDSREIILFPKRWEKKQYLFLGSVALSTAALIHFDENIRDRLQSNRTKDWDAISNYVAEPWGTPEIWKNYSLYSSLAFFTYGWLTDNRKAKSVALSATKAMVITSAFTLVPKNIFGRQRPNVHDGPDHLDWRGPFQGESFFSGHTSVTFAFASVVAEYYQETVWVPVLGYTLAAMTGLSRMYDNKHWTSDVFAGAAFGIAVGKMVARNDQKLFLTFNNEFNLPQLTICLKL